MSEGSAPKMVDLMAHVGFLLLHWGRLEAALQKSNGEMPEAARSDLDRVRQLRNLVAHSLARCSVDPRDVRGAHVVCRSREGAETVVTYAELDEAIRTLEKWVHQVRYTR